MSNQKTKIFLVDDHHIFREGIRAILEQDSTIKVIGEAADGNELIKKMNATDTNVLLLDIDMPKISGLHILTPIITQFPSVQVLVFSMHSNAEYVHDALSKGAKGYLLKSCRKAELFRAVNTVANGDTYLSEIVSKKLIQYIKYKDQHRKQKNDIPLTTRELQVLKLVSSGLTNLQIGKRLHISHRTVDTHRRNIMEKLDLHNAVALTNYATKKGLLDT